MSAEVHMYLTIREAEVSPTRPAGITRSEVSGLVDRFQLGNLFLGQVDNFEVRDDTLPCDRLWQNVNVGRVHLERDQHVGWSDVVLVGETNDNVVLQERRVVRTERRVGRDDDTGLCARSEDILLKTRWMTLDLIHSGNYDGDFE